MKFFFALLCLLSFSCSSSHKHRLAICAMFQNEAPWLKEWISYHHKVLGVDHFYLYNNDSTDDFMKVLQPFVDNGCVELIDWSSNDPSHCASIVNICAPWDAAQVGAYTDCLKNKAMGKARWVALIDIDEFIVPAKGVDAFYKMLRSMEKKGKGSIRLFWRIFGTSNVKTLASEELLTEKLVWRSRDDHPWNSLFKSIHRPEAIATFNIHGADKLKKPYRRYTLPRNEATIHHYWTRTEQVCFEKRKMSKSLNPEFFENLHQVKDETILRYIDQQTLQIP
jgi:hypothetical protein